MSESYSEQLRPGGQPADRALEAAGRDREIVEAATKGMRVHEIAAEFGLSDRQVSRILRDAAERVRADAAEVAADAFHLQRERLERMYRLVEMELQRYEQAMAGWLELPEADRRRMPAPHFDDKPFRVAVMIFDRQARLMGFDRGGKVDTIGPSGWLDQAPIEQVAAYAKQLGMTLPTQFDTPAPDAKSRG